MTAAVAIVLTAACLATSSCSSLSAGNAASGRSPADAGVLDAAAVQALEGATRAGAAAELYERAVAGDAESQRRLGLLHIGGEVVPRNLAAAVDWLARAAEQNDCAAQYHLGLVYLGGNGLPYDLAQAAFWLRRAADHPEECTS